MSIPPQLIRVKRKRDEEATPVTFLQFDDGVKRARSSNHWAYQRRDGASKPQSTSPRHDAPPVIHVSNPNDESTQSPKRPGAAAAPSPRKTLEPRPSLQRVGGAATPEPRRFHLSRAMMMKQGAQAPTPGVSKKSRASPAVFVERSRKKMARRSLNATVSPTEEMPTDRGVQTGKPGELEPPRKLKKPSTTRAKSPRPDAVTRAPPPVSAARPHAEDLDKIAADMNQWVLNEIGANLEEMEMDKWKQEDKFKFRPKAPAKRYQERHPDRPSTDTQEEQHKADTVMTDDVSEDDSDNSDWVIDEYVRIPANSMAVDVSPGDVGVLVLDGEEDDVLFFGPEHDEDDDYLEDDEDENAENYYTADYPEDEVDSDDEYNRHAYYYRTTNASDDEEFDNDLYSPDNEDSDEMVIEGDDDDVAMARIKAYMQRRHADAR
ncbi:hypothetical protein ACO1O0_000813 [Amphichorda felina]